MNNETLDNELELVRTNIQNYLDEASEKEKNIFTSLFVLIEDLTRKQQQREKDELSKRYQEVKPLPCYFCKLVPVIEKPLNPLRTVNTTKLAYSVGENFYFLCSDCWDKLNFLKKSTPLGL